MKRLIVGYNNAMRLLLQVPKWQSGSQLFVSWRDTKLESVFKLNDESWWFQSYLFNFLFLFVAMDPTCLKYSKN